MSLASAWPVAILVFFADGAWTEAHGRAPDAWTVPVLLFGLALFIVGRFTDGTPETDEDRARRDRIRAWRLEHRKPRRGNPDT